jgi:hypothetical protein
MKRRLSVLALSILAGACLGSALVTAANRRPTARRRYYQPQRVGNVHRSIGNIHQPRQITPDLPVLCTLSGSEDGWEYDAFLDTLYVYWTDSCSIGTSNGCKYATILQLEKWVDQGDGEFLLTLLGTYCTGGTIQCGTGGTDKVWLSSIKGISGTGNYEVHAWFYQSTCPDPTGNSKSNQQFSFVVN